jgi:hypothetical protein
MKFVEAMAQGFQNELQKIAFKGLSAKNLSSLSKILRNPAVYGPILGVAGWEGSKKMHKDWKIGRQVRKASGGRY